MQIEFKNSDAITIDLRDPDILQINIAKPELFIDAETGKIIDSQSWRHEIPVVPQYSAEAFATLVVKAERI